MVEGEFVARATIVGWLIICSFYIKCDLITGVIAMLGGLTTAKIAYVITDLDREEDLFGGQVLKVWFGLQAFGWITQFVGHGIYE